MQEKTLENINSLPDFINKNEEDVYFIKLLIEEKICSIEQISKFIDGKNYGYKFDIELALYLIKNSIATPEELYPLLDEAQRFYIRFGQLALNFKKIKKEDLKWALEAQKQIEVQKNIKLQIGDILFRKGKLTIANINEIIIKQREEITNMKSDNLKVLPNYKDISPGNIFSLLKYKSKIINIDVPEDQMSAKIIKFEKNPNITIEVLKKEFNSFGIVFGIVEDKKLQDFINNPILPFEFAVGKKPSESEDAKIIDNIEFLTIDENEKNLILKKENGSDTYQIPNVKENHILQMKRPLLIGEDGKDICCNKIESKKPNDCDIKLKPVKAYLTSVELYDNVNISETVLNYKIAKSKYNGVPCKNNYGEIFVEKKVTINEDIKFVEKKSVFTKQKNGNKENYFDLDINGFVENVDLSCENLFIKGIIKKSKIDVNTLKTLNIIESCEIDFVENLEAFKITNNSVIKSKKGIEIDDKGKLAEKGGIKVNEITDSTIICNFLDALSINSSKIKISIGLKVKEINLDKLKEPNIKIDSKIIYTINDTIKKIKKYSDLLKEFEIIGKNKKDLILKNERIKIEWQQIFDIEKKNILKKEFLESKKYIDELDKKINDILEIFSKIPGFKSVVKEEEIIYEVKKYIDICIENISILEENFLQNRKTPVLNIKKVLSDIIIITEGKKLKIEKGKINIILYENLFIDKEGLYFTALSEKRVPYTTKIDL